jgi:serine/threonine protein kinase
MATRPDNWEAVKALFEAALEKDSAHRSSFLNERCRDASVRAEVERLLAEHDQDPSFLSTPAHRNILVDPPATPPKLSERKVRGKRVLNIGPYTVIGEVGRGGMGVVYKATDPSDGQIVAIKMILGFAALNQQGRMGLVREARAAGSLNHPNIAKVYDIGQRKGQLYIVMEYLHGAPLDRVMRSRSVLSIGQKLHILIQLCDALDHAHCNGVIHRDVKPANVFIARDGTVKVVDFGLAVQNNVSGHVKFAGTIPYMSPEQLTNGPLDRRSDVWSVGITMYELLSGQLPFHGATRSDLCHRILNARVPVLDTSIPLAGELSHVLDWALAKIQDARYPTAKVLATDLRKLEHALEASLWPTQEIIEEPIVRTEPQPERENPIPSQSEEGPAHHYSGLDLGFRCNVAGPVSIRSGTFRMRQLRQRLEENWEFLKWQIPLTAFVLFGEYFKVGWLVLWHAAIFVALLWLLWRPLIYILKGADAVLRRPRCKGCRLTMSLTSSWTRFVTSNAEVVLGYQDCIAALQERMWQDAAKLLSIHGVEPTAFRTNKLISTPLRYHLQFYECGICSHHGARLTTDDLLEDDWRPRVQFTEAYCGAVAKTPPLLARLRSVPSRIADDIVGSFRHSDPIRINMRLIGGIVFLLLIVAAALIQERRFQKARERYDALSPRLSTYVIKARVAGLKYYYGNGVPRDMRIAAQYFEAAAYGGDGFSANQLGEMYENAIGLPRAYDKALAWYGIASGEGSSDAAMNLGRFYENGIEVDKDLAEAEVWYSIAAEQGNQNAKGKLAHLRPKQ